MLVLLLALIGGGLLGYHKATTSPTYRGEIIDESITVNPQAYEAQIHRAASENISGNSTYIDDRSANGDPDALLSVTPSWNPGGDGGIYNDHPTGVWYDADRQRWAVFNQDLARMPEGASFNVEVLPPSESGFIHRATSESTLGNSTYLDNPLTNDNPDAIISVTQNWNPEGASGLYNNHSVGVWYDGDARKWAVFNQDLARMPEDAAFNVEVLPPSESGFIYRATAGNISNSSTYLDDPLTNGDPDAVLLVTANWNPGGDGGTYDDHPIGVWYDGNARKWAIFNQDLARMPEGAAFNVRSGGK